MDLGCLTFRAYPGNQRVGYTFKGGDTAFVGEWIRGKLDINGGKK